MIRPEGKAKKIHETIMKGKEMARRRQGYDDRLDEHLGMAHRGHHLQDFAARRHEAEGMERHYGRRPYADIDMPLHAPKRRKTRRTATRRPTARRAAPRRVHTHHPVHTRRRAKKK